MIRRPSPLIAAAAAAITDEVNRRRHTHPFRSDVAHEVITDALMACDRTDGDDLPPGITSAGELMTAGEYRALDEELWGKWDAPTVALTEAERHECDVMEFLFADGGKS